MSSDNVKTVAIARYTWPAVLMWTLIAVLTLVILAKIGASPAAPEPKAATDVLKIKSIECESFTVKSGDGKQSVLIKSGPTGVYMFLTSETNGTSVALITDALQGTFMGFHTDRNKACNYAIGASGDEIFSQIREGEKVSITPITPLRKK